MINASHSIIYRCTTQALLRRFTLSSPPLTLSPIVYQHLFYSLYYYPSFDLRVKRPTKQQIALRMVAIGRQEGLAIETNAAEMLVEQVRFGSLIITECDY